MARFYGEVIGQRGKPVHRLGSTSSGVEVKAQGWEVGVTVDGNVDDGGNDSFDIWSTGGTNGGIGTRLLGTVKLVNFVPVFELSQIEKKRLGLPY